MHDHEINQLPEIDRRRFLQVAVVATGASIFGDLLSIKASAVESTIKLPGFSAFAKNVSVLKSGIYYLVESTGLPDHQMMVGITNWQQQIPTVQNYVGTNSWSIPLKPTIAAKPILAKDHFKRGAIALAVNGVPIFNALNNRGEDSFLIGELDNWGGHCGRADDYHYHAAPLHLQSIVGKKNPIAYALDGFPIYGEYEVNGKKAVGLDNLNGHFDSKKNYHYHGTKSYPYINGGFKGNVTEIEGQVDPQPSARPFRPAGNPLRGAKITKFERLGENEYELTYSVNGAESSIKYLATLNNVTLNFVDPMGNLKSESYKRL